MSKRRKTSSSGTMLELWRPPHHAGEPVGCLATTYTFAPGLFEEQCLARFLEIESDPNREDLAFLLERENRLGSVYVGVLVDHIQAGVEHSLRWDVLPVRIQAGKQHAKLSLLVWSQHIRIIVASANLTEPGYRTNHEVAASIDLTPEESNTEVLAGAVAFLRRLVLLVPGASSRPPEVRRAEVFLDQVERLVDGWKQSRRRGKVRQQLVFTLPAFGGSHTSSSSLEEAIHACRRRGGSPNEVWVASPFFDADGDTSRVTVALCKLMARGIRREICFCVPAIRDDAGADVLRLAAPRALLQTPAAYNGAVTIEMLPELDKDKNRRPWHAKMLAIRAGQYSALMIGSSNFTCAGMGAAVRFFSPASLNSSKIGANRRSVLEEADRNNRDHVRRSEHTPLNLGLSHVFRTWVRTKTCPLFFRQRVSIPVKSGQIDDPSWKKRTGITETMSGDLNLLTIVDREAYSRDTAQLVHKGSSLTRWIPLGQLSCRR